MSLATNDIGNQVLAIIEDSAVESTGAVIELNAASDARIKTVTTSAALSAGLSGNASVSLNEIGSTVDAHISRTSDVDAAGPIGLSASDSSTIESFSGNFSAGAASLGASVADNSIGNTVRAYIDNSEVDSDGSNVTIRASSNAEIDSIAVSGALGMYSGNASVAANTVGNTVEAFISSASVVHAGRPRRLQGKAAAEHVVPAFPRGLP